jgi:hypothetical protein
MTGAAYQPLAAEIHLERGSGSEPARVLEVWEELRPIAEPLALTLLLGHFQSDTGWREELDPPISTWQLVEQALPDRVGVEPPADALARRCEVPEIDRAQISRWFDAALAQPPPSPGVVVGVSSVHCHHIRAAIFDKGPDAEGYRLVYSDGILDMPVEHRRGQAYVLAPADGLALLLPPLAWTISRADDWLRLDFTVNWSPWLELQGPEGAGVRAAIERLRRRGWTLAEPTYRLQLVP